MFETFLGQLFYRTTPVAALELSSSIRKEFWKKKISGEIAFVLISLLQYKSLLADQLPQQYLSFLENLLNFIITKYLRQEVDDDWSVCGLSVTGDIKIYQCHVIER